MVKFTASIGEVKKWSEKDRTEKRKQIRQTREERFGMNIIFILAIVFIISICWLFWSDHYWTHWSTMTKTIKELSSLLVK